MRWHQPHPQCIPAGRRTLPRGGLDPQLGLLNWVRAGAPGPVASVGIGVQGLECGVQGLVFRV